MKQSHQSFSELTRDSKKTIRSIVTAVLATLLLGGLVSTQLLRKSSYIPSFAVIKTLGVKAFWDQKLTNEVTVLPWPKVYPGTSNNISLYLQSVSNIVTRLELQTSNWTLIGSNDTIILGPLKSIGYMNMTWNYNNTAIYPGQTLQVTFTLSLDKSEDFTWFLFFSRIEKFRFDIRISASEYS